MKSIVLGSIFDSLNAKAGDLFGRKKDVVEEALVPECDTAYASQAIASAILAATPFLAGRLGWVEASCLGIAKKEDMTDQALRDHLWHHAGVFPATVAQFDRFADSYLSALSGVDLLGIMRAPGEYALVKASGSRPLLAELSSLEPYFSSAPWSEHLRGKRVVVVHPFVRSIGGQYAARRAEIFADSRILPEFALRLIPAPQTIAGNTGGFSSWSDALVQIKRELEREEFDVAIVGCGAYGLPAGAHVKSLGKVCVHLGGATQILFGISGARWRDNPAFQALQTPAWRVPLESERPENWKKVEDGCYW